MSRALPKIRQHLLSRSSGQIIPSVASCYGRQRFTAVIKFFGLLTHPQQRK